MAETMATRVLVAEDEDAVRGAIERALQLEGYDVEVASTGEGALHALEDGGAMDAVVLDVLLPGMTGLDVVRRLREEGQRVPVLMLTARGAVDDRVAGLDAGADDYLVKPFALKELLARLRALIRRRAADGAQPLQFADLVLDPGSREVTRGGRRVELTRTEFNLLELFLRNPRQVLRRPVIYDRVWGYDLDADTHALEVYIGYLRRKMEQGGEPRLLHTVRGVGYALREQ